MYISPWPGITPRDLFRVPAHADLPYPLNAPHRLGFCVARSGIYHLFGALHLKSTDVVLVPDYHSGNEVSAMLAAGANIVYYPIQHNLDPDLEALTRLARKHQPRVIYTIHYLGWAQPLREIQSLAREFGSIVVEDCALSMLSESEGTPLGASGDYSIFCVYKTLPVPNGGLLVQNRNILPDLDEVEIQPYPRLASAGRTAELAFEALRSRSDRVGKFLFDLKQGVGRALRRNGVNHVPVGDIGWNPANVHIGMSPLAESIMRSLDYARIRAQRRENFMRLRDLLPDASMLREDLPQGICPLFFPILVEDKTAAAKSLHDRGISAVEFWNDLHPHAAPHVGADASFLHKHVLELPIHQDVTPKQIEYIAQELQNLCLRRAHHFDSRIAEPAAC